MEYRVNTGSDLFTAQCTGLTTINTLFMKPNNSNVTGYHTYSIEWNPNYIRWFLDGVHPHGIRCCKRC